MSKPLAGSLGHRSNGTDWTLFVPGVGLVIMDPRVRNSLLLQDWEGEALSSTGPLPHGMSVHYSAKACAARENQPIGLGFVKALVNAVVNVHREDGNQ